MKPTVGRIVHFYTKDVGFWGNGVGEGPYAAIVTRVWSDNCVNLTVFPDCGNPYTLSSVTNKVDDWNWWAWPPREETS